MTRKHQRKECGGKREKDSYANNITRNICRELKLYNIDGPRDVTDVTADSPLAERAPWTYLTNHAHVLILAARNANATMREFAEAVGITERAVQRIVSELEEAGVLQRTREGRRNSYSVDPTRRLRHPIEGHCTVAELLALVNGPQKAPEPNRPTAQQRSPTKGARRTAVERRRSRH